MLPKGYPLEEHFVTTSDGYVLGYYRLPAGKATPSRCAALADAAPLLTFVATLCFGSYLLKLLPLLAPTAAGHLVDRRCCSSMVRGV